MGDIIAEQFWGDIFADLSQSGLASLTLCRIA